MLVSSVDFLIFFYHEIVNIDFDFINCNSLKAKMITKLDVNFDIILRERKKMFDVPVVRLSLVCFFLFIFSLNDLIFDPSCDLSKCLKCYFIMPLFLQLTVIYSSQVSVRQFSFFLQLIEKVNQ